MIDHCKEYLSQRFRNDCFVYSILIDYLVDHHSKLLFDSLQNGSRNQQYSAGKGDTFLLVSKMYPEY